MAQRLFNKMTQSIEMKRVFNENSPVMGGACWNWQMQGPPSAINMQRLQGAGVIPGQ
jgi:hypothetical protein